MTQLESVTAEDEAMFLEDNIATVAFHLGQPGARMSVGYEGGSKLIVDPGEVLKEISRRLRTPSQPAASGAQLSALDDASNACLELAAEHGFATGHGDTVADMISEFSGQIGNRHAELQAEIERLTDEVGAYAMALEQCRHHTPAQCAPDRRAKVIQLLWEKQFEGSPWHSKFHLIRPDSLEKDYGALADTIITAVTSTERAPIENKGE